MKVVVAIDDSPHSQMVLASVCKRHWPMDTQFKLLTVMEPVSVNVECDPEEAEMLIELKHRRMDHLTKQCAAARHHLEKTIPDSLVHFEVREGDPKHVIVSS